MTAPTPAEIDKVRRYECSLRGHTFTEILVVGSGDPVRIICSNCSDSWAVVPKS